MSKSPGGQIGFYHSYRPTNPYREPRQEGLLRLSVSVDAETYAAIDALAQKSNCRVGRMAVTLMELGLFEFEKGGDDDRLL